MEFSEKIKDLRLKHGFTQKVLAQKIGVSTRSLINYETGRCYPRQASVVAALADVLGVSADYLLNNTSNSPEEAKGQREASALVQELSALFAGGSLNEADRDAAMQAIQRAYWDGRRKDRE